ncbi:lytic transglycosylase domain-containing protein [Patescibacteria group bacterium]|nr:lytic transglycosylase domain-containing protein [Patescibacteria group bacterium]
MASYVPSKVALKWRKQAVAMVIVALILGFIVGRATAREIVIMHDDLTPEVFTVLEGPELEVMLESVLGPEIVVISTVEDDLPMYEQPASTYDVDFVAGIIHEVNPSNTHETARCIANEIVYQMTCYEIDQYENMPYVLAMFYQESRFNPLAANPRSTARGVGQILMSMHGYKFENYEDWKDPAENIALSFRILMGNYNENLNLDTKWRRAFGAYCGNEASARNVLRHVDRFARLLN